MTHILVTGGAGFIGSHLIEELSKNPDHHITSVDNYSLGSKDNHVDCKRVQYVCLDTRDINSLPWWPSPDIVFHLGEYSRVEQSFKDIRTTWEYNKQGTFEVLEFCRKHKAKIVYAGSSTKFGDGGLGRDQSPYAWTKASNTELVRNYGEWYDLPYAITYFYNAYGPRELTTGSYATILGIFREQYKTGKPLTVVSPGTQIRNFTYVKDIVKGLILVGEKGLGDDYGLGYTKSYSVLDIANMFVDNDQSRIQFLPPRKGNRMDSSLNLNRSSLELGWSATKDVKDYIEECKKVESTCCNN